MKKRSRVSRSYFVFCVVINVLCNKSKALIYRIKYFVLNRINEFRLLHIDKACVTYSTINILIIAITIVNFSLQQVLTNELFSCKS